MKVLKGSILMKDILTIHQLMAAAIKNFNLLNIFIEPIRIERMVLERDNVLTLSVIVFLISYPSFLTKLIAT
jgi:hypothetical protein